jgi:hypothetical protein
MQILLYNIFVPKKHCIGDFLEGMRTSQQEKETQNACWYLEMVPALCWGLMPTPSATGKKCKIISKSI